MTNNDITPTTSESRSMSGGSETSEPAGGSSTAGSTTPTQSQNSSQSTLPSAHQQRSESGQRQPSSSTTGSASGIRPPPSNLFPTSSANASPQTSRNSSPVRKDSRPNALQAHISTQPSAAAIQRALSATTVPQLQSGSVTEAVARLPRSAKSASAAGSGDSTPQWPMSPGLKSPPPSTTVSRRGSAAAQKKPDIGSAAPSINVQSPSPQVSTPPPKQSNDELRRADAQLQAPSKVPSRGPSGKSMLETVQEASSDSISEPLAAVQAAADLRPLSKLSEDDKSGAKKEGQEIEKHTQHGESGSESAGSKADRRGRRPSLNLQQNKNTQQKPASNKAGYTPLSSAKSRQGDGKQGMTVETETVASIPQSALGTGDRTGSGRIDHSGTIRLRPSNETIRPKKERKKPTQKARSVNQGTGMCYTTRSPLLLHRDSFEWDDTGYDSVASTSCDSTIVAEEAQTLQQAKPYWQHAISARTPRQYMKSFSDKWLRKASSKADIFEARVASAVDEANTSDSDETFVYESNPPEQQRRPRHHSRTPSVTSSHSTADQRSAGIRSFGDVMDERRVAGKRSMKFSNNANYNDVDSPESHNGTVRSHQARHFGKFGRGGSHASMYDPDSPFTQASKLKTAHVSGRHSSRPNSPRSPQTILHTTRPSGLFSGRKEQSFDLEGEGADDERTPLMGTVRTPRTPRHARRLHTDSVRSIDEYYGAPERSRCGRFGGCLLGFCVMVAVVLSAVAFLVMSNRPMYDVQIRKIQNVLASEQEIMLDLMVGAVNPNALGITVGDLDVNVFAKSRHVGSSLDPNGTVEVTTRESGPSSPRRRTEQHPAAKDGNPNPWQDMTGHWHAPVAGPEDNRDDGTDPPDDNDLEKDAHTMLLGRIFHFDQALIFEGSPIKRHPHYSLGEVRLMHPGNKTELDGTARWEKVLQHPFELIVRGVLRYQLPVSSRTQSVSVGASICVHPEDGVDDEGNMRVTPVDHSNHWQLIDWDELEDELHVSEEIRMLEET